jgi:NADPH:quinone reductase-like Zn-dependent oxidoreductase
VETASNAFWAGTPREWRRLVGSDCTIFKHGDKVYYAGSVTRPGCDSEFHVVDDRIVGNMPKTLTFAQALPCL